MNKLIISVLLLLILSTVLSVSLRQTQYQKEVLPRNPCDAQLSGDNSHGDSAGNDEDLE